VTYLCTTFPKLTETFLQREIRALRQLPIDLELFSLWGGGRGFEGMVVHRFSAARLAALLWLLPYWVARNPKAFLRTLRGLVKQPVPSWKNLGETLVGLGFAVTYATLLRRGDRRPDLIHAAWATMPATAAQLLSKLIDVPFTMGAHAYDVYQDGGDWLLPGKLEDAALIVTSTRMTRDELLARGAVSNKVAVVRRGLYPFPALGVPRARRDPLRVLSVARLVEKKGIFTQLAIFAEMKRRQIRFEARVIGDGPLAGALHECASSQGISHDVTFVGSLPFDQVLEQYAWADVLLFTGSVARDGDRDGLPNVVLEAMATGTPVVVGTGGAAPELVRHGYNGVLVSNSEPDEWIEALVRLRDDDVYYRRLRDHARKTVEDHSDARVNGKTLLRHFAAVRDG
jgi:glycosyltransferase involved in cell wall biosynthesis